MKNNEKLIEAIGGIDGSMINSAFERKSEKKSRAGLIEAIGCVAAVAALAVFAVVLSHYARKDDNVSSPPAETVEGKSVKESDYNKFDTSYYSYEEGDYRFDLTTYTPKDEHFFFECELAISNMSDHDISIYKLGEYGSFFDFVCNFTRGDYHQILHYRGTADKDKTKITLAPGQSYSENLTLITQVSEKLTKTYIQAPHNVEVRSSVTVYPYEQKSGLFLFDIMRIQGTEYVKDAGKSGIVLTDRSAVREIPGGWGYVSAAEDESYSYAEIKLSELLKSASVAYSLPSLIPEGYVVTHTDMTGSINSPEKAQSLSLGFADNANNAVREERDEDGNVVFNTDRYNRISIEMYKKSFWENTDYGDFIKEKWLIGQDLSEFSIGKKRTEENNGYKFLIQAGEYYVLYTFKEVEGGKRNLSASDIYRIAASTPYIIENGYKESGTSSDAVFMTPAELADVVKVHVSTSPYSIDLTCTLKGDDVRPITDRLSSLRIGSKVTDPNDVEKMLGMGWMIELTYNDGKIRTFDLAPNNIREEGKDYCYLLDEDEARDFSGLLSSTAAKIPISEKMPPDDFSFSLVWNTFGISSYDSKTGKLIKTTDTSNVKKYTATYKMTDGQIASVYSLLIQLTDYPEIYDPYNDPESETKLVSTPSRTVIIKFTANGKTKTIQCKEISFGSTGYNDLATKFLRIERQLEGMVTSSDEWLTLPDYEVYYD